MGCIQSVPSTEEQEYFPKQPKRQHVEHGQRQSLDYANVQRHNRELSRKSNNVQKSPTAKQQANPTPAPVASNGTQPKTPDPDDHPMARSYQDLSQDIADFYYHKSSNKPPIDSIKAMAVDFQAQISNVHSAGMFVVESRENSVHQPSSSGMDDSALDPEHQARLAEETRSATPDIKQSLGKAPATNTGAKPAVITPTPQSPMRIPNTPAPGDGDEEQMSALTLASFQNMESQRQNGQSVAVNNIQSVLPQKNDDAATEVTEKEEEDESEGLLFGNKGRVEMREWGLDDDDPEGEKKQATVVSKNRGHKKRIPADPGWVLGGQEESTQKQVANQGRRTYAKRIPDEPQWQLLDEAPQKNEQLDADSDTQYVSDEEDGVSMYTGTTGMHNSNAGQSYSSPRHDHKQQRAQLAGRKLGAPDMLTNGWGLDSNPIMCHSPSSGSVARPMSDVEESPIEGGMVTGRSQVNGEDDEDDYVDSPTHGGEYQTSPREIEEEDELEQGGEMYGLGAAVGGAQGVGDLGDMVLKG